MSRGNFEHLRRQGRVDALVRRFDSFGNRQRYDSVHVARILAHTEKALLVRVKGPKGARDLWIPRSAVEEGHEFSRGCEDLDLHIAAWFVEQEAL